MEKGVPYREQFEDKADRAQAEEALRRMRLGIPNLGTTKPPEDDDAPDRIEVRARAAIEGERSVSYGDAPESFALIAQFWTIYLRSQKGTRLPAIRPHQVAMMMGLLKVARLAKDPADDDSLMDLIGYSILANEVKPDPETQDWEA